MSDKMNWNDVTESQDPAANRVKKIGENATETDSGWHIDPTSIPSPGGEAPNPDGSAGPGNRCPRPGGN